MPPGKVGNCWRTCARSGAMCRTVVLLKVAFHCPGVTTKPGSGACAGAWLARRRHHNDSTKQSRERSYIICQEICFSLMDDKLGKLGRAVVPGLETRNSNTPPEGQAKQRSAHVPTEQRPRYCRK